jgi:hypothetical protein
MDHRARLFDTLKGGTAMTVLKRMIVIMALLMGVMGLIANSAFASSQHASVLNRCGGVANTKSQLLHNWDRMGVTGSVSRLYGIQSVNETLASRVNSSFGLATLSAKATVKNFGCSGGAVKSAGNKTLRAGTRVWIDKTSLQAKFPGAFSLSAKAGFKKVSVWVQSRAQSSCSNPVAGFVRIWIWVKVGKPPSAPSPTPPGSCNAINSPGAVVCSTISVWVTCGVVQMQFGSLQSAQQWAAVNCSTAVISPPCVCNSPPPPGCTQNCGPPPPCTQNCTPPPCTQNCIPPKDGTQGPGAGTPGQPGGTGAGGSPGAGAGPMCRDASGNIVPGTPDPVTGNCPGVTDSGTSGGPSNTGPPPPTQGTCIDAVTLQTRTGTADQFGYCT